MEFVFPAVLDLSIEADVKEVDIVQECALVLVVIAKHLTWEMYFKIVSRLLYALKYVLLALLHTNL